MKLNTAYQKYSSYSLLEMLVVMSIIIIIMGIGFGTFSGLNSAIALGESMATLRQDIKNTQRSAMFVERSSTERWLYGLGIDFSRIEIDGSYRIFKWCSQFPEYGDVLTKSKFPNYNPASNLSLVNGNLTLTSSYIGTGCPTSSSVSQIVSSGDMIRSVSKNLIATNTSRDAVGDIATKPVYVLFESVSGKAFLYDATGRIVNYSSTGEVISRPSSLVVSLQSKTNGVIKRMSLNNISGKIDEYNN